MDGIIPVWKERGMTSHDVVFRLRWILKEKKIGHTGTLDPDVDGVLVCCVGQATKLVELLTDKEKQYIGEITLGFQTDTEDASGAVVKTEPLTEPFTKEAIQDTMKTLEGDIIQIPPMYSAVKVNGKRLYEYARAGEVVERPKHQIHVEQFTLTDTPVFHSDSSYQSFHFLVTCGKGTYVRTLATDLGAALGVPATMTDLTRIQSSPYRTKDCVTLKDIEERIQTNDWSFLQPLESALTKYPIWQVPESLERLVRNGAVLHQTQLPDQLPVRAYVQGTLTAIYAKHPTQIGEVKPLRMFK
ncbi:MAG: tRNA pseudouridine(55) synthase TruB [Aerococcus sp.]|nr:tRNA pseudouridine(55) synthase TruB [Aerococcus sp.]